MSTPHTKGVSTPQTTTPPPPHPHPPPPRPSWAPGLRAECLELLGVSLAQRGVQDAAPVRAPEDLASAPVPAPHTFQPCPTQRGAGGGGQVTSPTKCTLFLGHNENKGRATKGKSVKCAHWLGEHPFEGWVVCSGWCPNKNSKAKRKGALKGQIYDMFEPRSKEKLPSKEHMYMYVCIYIYTKGSSL